MGERPDGIGRRRSAPVGWLPQSGRCIRLRRREKMNGVRSLPHDLVVSIMSRLPIKSLIRFKSVSKPWANSIDDPSFIKSHAKQTTNSRLIVGFDDWRSNVTYYSMATDSPQNLVREDFPEFPKHYNIFVGSCNGLVCLVSYELNDITGIKDVVDIFVWNIAIKECRIIPNPTTTTHKHSRYCFGFGYDSVHDDYKVVRLGGPCGVFPASDFTSYEMQFYSVRRDVWSAIKVYPTSTFYFSFGSVDESLLYVNNALHKAARRRKEEKFKFVLAIDLVTEEFREVSYPQFLHGGCLVAIGGCLGVVFGATWVMKDYGVKESWTKLPLPDDARSALGKVDKSLGDRPYGDTTLFFPFSGMDGSYRVIYILDGHCHWRSFWYEENKREFEEVVEARWSFPLTDVGMDRIIYAEVYLETLFSLKFA